MTTSSIPTTNSCVTLMILAWEEKDTPSFPHHLGEHQVQRQVLKLGMFIVVIWLMSWFICLILCWFVYRAVFVLHVVIVVDYFVSTDRLVKNLTIRSCCLFLTWWNIDSNALMWYHFFPILSFIFHIARNLCVWWRCVLFGEKKTSHSNNKRHLIERSHIFLFIVFFFLKPL